MRLRGPFARGHYRRVQLTRRDILAMGLGAIAVPTQAAAPPLVFAAASLKGVLDRIAEEVAPMRLAYGGSGALARQIIQGAPADLFLSANTDWMEAVSAARPVLQRKPLLGNRLVLIAGPGVAQSAPPEWQQGDRLAMGFVDAVPAGQYGKAAFEAQGLWDLVADKVVETDSVSAALTLVAQGALPYGVVYATDALAEPRVSVIAEFDATEHPPITYPLALINEAGRSTYSALRSPKSAAIFKAAGFEVL